MRRVRLLVAYDGTDFHGFAPNDGVRTVLGTLSEAVATVVRQPVELTGAGRTDAGVHGWGQVVSGDLPDDVDLGGLSRRVNKLCAPDVAIRSATWTSPDFDARFSAQWRHYRYEIWSGPAPNPLVARRAWWVHRPLALWAMRAGADAVVGEHDFSSFCRRPKVGEGYAEPSLTRRVISATWRELTLAGDAGEHRDGGSLLRFEIRANAFCHQMVRSIVGTLVDVGSGKLSPGHVKAILDAKDRAAAGQVAPPTGLTLWEVGYPAEL